MKHLEQAREADKCDIPIEAVDNYQKAFFENDQSMSVDDYINYAVLLFECRDFGYAAHHKIPDDMMARCHAESLQVLREAEIRFGNNAEIRFWKKYIDYVVLGEPPFDDEALECINAGTDIPYFYLFAGTMDRKYAEKARLVYERVLDKTTSKKRYI